VQESEVYYHHYSQLGGGGCSRGKEEYRWSVVVLLRGFQLVTFVALQSTENQSEQVKKEKV
jgi:hypothetical protein